MLMHANDACGKLFHEITTYGDLRQKALLEHHLALRVKVVTLHAGALNALHIHMQLHSICTWSACIPSFAQPRVYMVQVSVPLSIMHAQWIFAMCLGYLLQNVCAIPPSGLDLPQELIMDTNKP